MLPRYASGRERLEAHGKTVGLVPTMGALHAGHASLIRAAGKSWEPSAQASSSTQRSSGRMKILPAIRAPSRRLRTGQGGGSIGGLCSFGGRTLSGGAATFVEVEGLSGRLDGSSRPGHFRGVATVVAKLMIATEADKAFFGQKDAAQVAVLRRMAADLLLPTELVICPIVREADGLALSSRNIYLSPEERARRLS